MTKYLQFDGVDDNLYFSGDLFLSSMEVTGRFYRNPGVYSDVVASQTDSYFLYVSINSAGEIEYEPETVERVFINEIEVYNGTPFDDYFGELVTIKIEFKALDWSPNLGLYYPDFIYLTKADIYDMKLIDFDYIVAHYDFSTGTTNDQSGNGNHLGLDGGTWLEDDGGEVDPPDEGNPVSYSYNSLQTIFADRIQNNTLQQSLYSQLTNHASSQQKIYKSIRINSDLKHQITTLRQATADTLQTIYSYRLANYDTLQQLFEQVVIVKNYDLKIIINKSVSSSYDLKQFMTADRHSDFDLSQVIYADFKNEYATKQVIYKQAKASFDTLQEIFNESVIRIENYAMQIVISKKTTSDFDTQQLINKTIKTYADLKQIISLLDVLDVDTRQTITKQINSKVDMLQRLNSKRIFDYDTLIRLRDDLLDVIGTIYLQAKRELDVFLKAEQKLYEELQAKRQLYITLRGDVNMTAINQNFSMYQGESKYISFPIDGVENLNDLTTVRWGLRKNKNTKENVFIKTGTVVENKVQIKLEPEDTVDLVGTHYHECEAVDSLGNESTLFTGMCTIEFSGLPNE